MFQGRSVAVVMPAYNVAPLIAEAVSSVPSLVDHLLVVDDCSVDATAEVLAGMQRPGLVRQRHTVNQGVGAAIATGYTEALRLGAEVVAVMAGDGQMDPADLPALLEPVVCGDADYVKGDRFRHADVWRVMPRDRLLGNIALSLLTRVTSGYWGIFDSQCGYTAISRQALLALTERDGRPCLFPRYGYPNDLLARLRALDAWVDEVPVRPVYEGQPSGIRLRTVFYPILFVLARSMGRRLWAQRLRPLLPRAEAPKISHAHRPAKHLLPAPPP